MWTWHVETPSGVSFFDEMSMNQESVELHTRRLIAQWKAAPTVRVVSRPQDLPVPAPEGVRGAYLPWSKETFIVAETHLSQAVAATTAHEVVAHHGVRDMMSRAAWSGFMRAIQTGATKDERLQLTRMFVRSVYRDKADETCLSRTLESDEVVAALAEALVDHRTGRIGARNPWRSLFLAARGHAAREILLRDDPASFEEVQGVLLAAEHRLRHGGLFWGTIRKCYASVVTKPMGPKKPARSLAESQMMLRDSRSHLEWLGEVKFVGAIIFLLASIPLLLWAYGSVFADIFQALFIH